MRTLHRKLVRELYDAKGLLFLIASIIAVGVTCFVAMQSAYHNLDEAKRRYYSQCRMADFWIDLKKVPLAELETLHSISGITEIRSRIRFMANVDLEHFAEPVSGMVLSLPDRMNPVINGVVLRQGDYFTDHRQNEVIVNEKFADAHNLSPGQTIHLVLNNRRQELFIVGTAISSEFTYLVGPGSFVPDPIHYGVFYIKRSYAEDVFDFDGAANEVVGILAPEARERVDEILLRAERMLDPYGVFATTPLDLQQSDQFLSNEIRGLGEIATVIPTIFLAVAALVLNVLITRMARRQRAVVGTLKALGYYDQQIFWHFLTYGLCVGLLGGLLGSVFGYLCATGMTSVYAWFFEFPDLRSEFFWYTHAIGMSVSLGCALIGSLRGSRAMLKLQPAEAMRPEPPKRGGRVWLERILGPVWQRLSSSWRMVFRSLLRHRTRTATGVFAAMMGAGLLVSGFMMTEAQAYLLSFQFYRTARSDIDVTFESEQGIEALTEISRLPGVDYAEPLLSVACDFVNGPYQRKGGITGLVNNARLTVPYDSEGRQIRVPETGVVLTKRLAMLLHVSPGDRLTMIPVKGERRPVEIVVARIADSYMGLSAYAQIDYLSGLVGESLVMSGAQLTTVREPVQLERLYRELRQKPNIQGVQSRRAMIKQVTETLLQNQYVFIGILVLFSGIIFFGSIVNASMVNLAERQREVGTFRALGYSEWQIGGMFLRENLLTNLTGTLLGLPVGWTLTWLTAVSYNNDLIRLPVVSAPWVWWTTIAVAVVFALAAHAVVQVTLSRMDYLEALKVKE
ncbi:MAG: FtsX-like permease family protein [Planctomycetes bacterium]|nr:FtsX-like permease family protein [Planctomycetota bacterium]